MTSARASLVPRPQAARAISDSCTAVYILVVTMFQLLLLTLASWTTGILQALSVPVQCA